MLDVNCQKVSHASQGCEAKQSFVKYICEKGYIFDNNDGITFFHNFYQFVLKLYY